MGCTGAGRGGGERIASENTGTFVCVMCPVLQQTVIMIDVAKPQLAESLAQEATRDSTTVNFQ